MFMNHFKLAVQPFGVTPDPNFLYLSNTHREALASLFYGIHAGRGFAALIAAPGMGKTTLLFHLLSPLMGNAKTAFLFQTFSEPKGFLRCLLTDLGIDAEGQDLAQMQAKLNSYLVQESKMGRQVVVVIDEAQNLDDGVLELVRTLSNFESPSKKLIHLVLSGQPQLAQRLSSERLVQLRQRVSIIAKLSPLKPVETREYIEHRLRVAGAASKEPIFSKEAYEMIAEHSCGIPRNINNLCFNSMSLACALKRSQVEASMVQEAIDDLDLRLPVVHRHSPDVPHSSLGPERGTVWPAPLRSRMPLAAGFLVFLACAGGLAWAALRGGVASRPAVPELTPLRAVLAPEQGDKQTHEGKEKTLASAPRAGERVRISTSASDREGQGNSNPRPGRAANQPKPRDSQVPVEVGELPLPVVNFERLWRSRITEFPANRQIPEHLRPPSDKILVPFELATQREKP